MEGIREFLAGHPSPYQTLDDYFKLLPNAQFFPVAFLNEILLSCKRVPKKRKLHGFGYKKALKNPWQYPTNQCIEDTRYRHWNIQAKV